MLMGTRAQMNTAKNYPVMPDRTVNGCQLMRFVMVRSLIAMKKPSQRISARFIILDHSRP